MMRPVHVGVARLAARYTRSVDIRLGLLDVVRRPRAAVIEAVAVMTAVTMISLSWTALSSIQAATSARLSSSSLPDLTVGAIAASSPISPATSSQIRQVRGLRSVVAVPFGRSVVVRGTGKTGPATLAIGTASGDVASLRSVLPGSLGVDSFRDDTVYLPTSDFPPFTPGSSVVVRGPSGTLRGMHVRYVPGLPVPSMLTPGALAKVSRATDIRMLLLALRSGVDRAAVIGRVEGVALLNNQLPVSGPAVLDVGAAAAFSSARGVAAAVLAFAVLVAILGAAATGALSIKEQGREHATLRALGLPRRKLGKLLTTRILVIALVAAGQGVLTGAAIGLIIARQVVVTLGLSPALGIPLLPIMFLVLITIAAIRVAALAPMERASYVPPSRALAQS
jgi:putative ABC transport system permease protein